MMRIGLGLSVCDRCGSVVYQPTTTTTTEAAPETTLYLTDNTDSPFGQLGLTDLSTTHDVVTFASADGVVAATFIAYQPIASATWGTWGGSITVKVTGTLTSDVSISIGRYDSTFLDYVNKVEGIVIASQAGSFTVTIPSTDWDDNVTLGGVPGTDADVLMINIFTPSEEPTDSFTIDCTNPTDTYLTLDAELDPQPWPAVTTTTTT